MAKKKLTKIAKIHEGLIKNADIRYYGLGYLLDCMNSTEYKDDLKKELKGSQEIWYKCPAFLFEYKKPGTTCDASSKKIIDFSENGVARVICGRIVNDALVNKKNDLINKIETYGRKAVIKCKNSEEYAYKLLESEGSSFSYKCPQFLYEYNKSGTVCPNSHGLVASFTVPEPIVKCEVTVENAVYNHQEGYSLASLGISALIFTGIMGFFCFY